MQGFNGNKRLQNCSRLAQRDSPLRGGQHSGEIQLLVVRAECSVLGRPKRRQGNCGEWLHRGRNRTDTRGGGWIILTGLNLYVASLGPQMSPKGI